MFYFSPHIILLSVAAAASGVVHSEGAYTNGWQKLGVVSAATPVQFTIVVKERNADRVKQISREVSDPTSPKYGKFLTQDELDQLTAPAAADMTTVTSWLEARSIVNWPPRLH